MRHDSQTGCLDYIGLADNPQFGDHMVWKSEYSALRYTNSWCWPASTPSPSITSTRLARNGL